MCLVARLVTVTGRHDFEFDASAFHCFNQLVFKLVNVLHVWLHNPDLVFCCLDHVQDSLTDLSLQRRLLLEKLTDSIVLVFSFIKTLVNLVKLVEHLIDLSLI